MREEALLGIPCLVSAWISSLDTPAFLSGTTVLDNLQAWSCSGQEAWVPWLLLF